MSCILFLIEISTIGTHCLVAQDRVFFLKKNLIKKYKHKFHYDDHLVCPF